MKIAQDEQINEKLFYRDERRDKFKNILQKHSEMPPTSRGEWGPVTVVDKISTLLRRSDKPNSSRLLQRLRLNVASTKCHMLI